MIRGGDGCRKEDGRVERGSVGNGPDVLYNTIHSYVMMLIPSNISFCFTISLETLGTKFCSLYK